MNIIQRIKRNEDAISQLEAKEDLDFMHKQFRITWHQKRIFYWTKLLEQETI